MVEELDMTDDILAPRDTVLVKYQGRNPYVAAAIAPGLIKDIMKISSKDLYEHDIRWDASGENREFYGRWKGRRGEDRWTNTWIRIVIQGSQHAKEKTGWVNVEIKGTITTKYSYSNFIQRWFWWFFNRTFYYKQRRKILEAAKDDIYEIRDVFQRTFGIEPR